MDRLKFRVWENTEKKYHHFDIASASSLDDLAFWANEKLLSEMYETNPKEFCTGLKDKNGKLIYDGDIVKNQDAWYDKAFAIRFGIHRIGLGCGCGNIFDITYLGVNLDESGEYSDKDFEKNISQYIEIIGNIHENSDLLTERK